MLQFFDRILQTGLYILIKDTEKGVEESLLSEYWGGCLFSSMATILESYPLGLLSISIATNPSIRPTALSSKE